MLYVIGGASGSGKTTLLPLLKRSRPDVQWHDFDERWTGGGKRERQELTQGWVRSALDHGGSFGLLGPCPLGELLAVPGAPLLAGLRHVLLDVGDVERVHRLRARGDGQDTQEVLNWAAWLRVHQALPDWRPDVLTEGSWEEMRWKRWRGHPNPEWPGNTLDSSGLTPAHTAAWVLAWMDAPGRVSPPR